MNEELPLSADALVEAAIRQTGVDDFGGDEWREGLDVLVDSLVSEANLNELGRAVATAELSSYLKARLGIVDYANQHPEEAGHPVQAPMIVIGQARTGTTILFDLLALDARLRAPLTWEVELPVPPPDPATAANDPRIEKVDEQLSAVDLLIPEFRSMHPMGARMAQECVRIFYLDFRSGGFPIQYRVPSYAEWLFDDADMSSAYRFHRRFLGHLSSRQPTGRWLLKSPAHLWSLDALMNEYPDAVLVQTHRDPLRIFASLGSMFSVARRLSMDPADIDYHEVSREWATYVASGLDRSVVARRDGTVPAERVVDLQFADFMADPLTTVRAVYELADLELTAEVEQRMLDFLVDNSQHIRADHRYTWTATGLDRQEWRARTADYVEFFEVSTESFD